MSTTLITPSCPTSCPTSNKTKFENRAAAENFERNHRDQNGQQAVYECACGKFHLTSTGSDRIVGGPVTRNSSSWMSQLNTPKAVTHMTNTDKVMDALTRYGGSRTAKEISEELGVEVSLVYTCSKASGIAFMRGSSTAQIGYSSGLQTLNGIALRKQQMLKDMATLEAQEEKLKLEAIEQTKTRVRMSDFNDGMIVISASGREIRLTPLQYEQLVNAVKTFVVVPVKP